DYLAGIFGILVQHGHNLFHRNRIVALAPAVVVGDHGDGGVADFGFAGQLGFLQVGHTDHVGAPASVEVRLCPGGKLRAFHADISAARFPGDPGGGAAPSRSLGHNGTNRIAKGDVADDAVAEKGGDAKECAVDELIGDDEIRGLVLFLQRTNRGNGKNALDAQFFESEDVSAEV